MNERRLQQTTRRNLIKRIGAMAAGHLIMAYPDLGLQVYNRGISGNKIPDLAARWQEDAIDLKPAFCSLPVRLQQGRRGGRSEILAPGRYSPYLRRPRPHGLHLVRGCWGFLSP